MFEARTWGDISRLQYGKALSGYRDVSSGIVPVYGTNGQTGVTDTPLAPGPGLIIGRKGAYRGVHYSEDPFWVIDTAFYLQAAGGIDLRWAYYSLRLSDINGLDSGSAIPSTTRESFYALPVCVPSVNLQIAIAEVLGALDDKIAANTKTSDVIHARLDALFDASILANPQAFRLEEIATFLNRQRVPLSASQREAKKGRVPYYGASGIFGFVNEALFDESLLLIGEDGSVIREDGTPVSQYIWGPAWVNNHAHVLTGSGLSTELLFIAVRRLKVGDLVTGAAQPKINMGNLRRLVVTLPAVESIAPVEQKVVHQMGVVRSLHDENQSLANIRDTLLPQLMSGKLRVRDAERTVSEVL